MDFEQLAFIEKSRRRALRGSVVALDSTRGEVLVTLRVGDFGETVDLRGRDETGAIRKQRTTLGDRLFVAFRYPVDEVTPGTGAASDHLVAKGAHVEGRVTATGELTELDLLGATVLVEGAELAAFADGDTIRCRIVDEGRAYVIPTR